MYYLLKSQAFKVNVAKRHLVPLARLREGRGEGNAHGETRRSCSGAARLAMSVRLILTLALVPLLALSGCATNYVHPEFEPRMSRVAKLTFLLVHLEVSGLELGGLRRERLPEDEAELIQILKRDFSRESQQEGGLVSVVYTPAELIERGYSVEEAARDAELLARLLKTAMISPDRPARGEELEAVRRLAARSAADIVGLGDLRAARFASDQSKAAAVALALILAAAGQGQYGAPPSSRVTSTWALIDPSDGSVLRVLEKTTRGPGLLR
jgi:hypothetical protein